MVSTLSILAIIFTCILTILFPTVLFIYFRKHYKASFNYFFMGIAIFSIFQLIIRIPLLQMVSGKLWFTVYISSNKYVYGAFLAITAALVEEIGRYLAFRFILLDHRKWENGYAFGIGHGGIEAFSIVGINYFLMLLLTIHMNLGWFSNIVTQFPQLLAAKSILLESPAEMLLLAGVERFFVLFIQIGFSLLVLDAVKRIKPGLLGLAILLHALLDFIAVLIGGNILIVEGIIAIAAMISIYYIKSKKRFWDYIM
ncbi:MAG: YhfC family intramembrane metalloprotease [Eubacteriales bacterium]